ncbi:MAG: biliverdin-producing heme oxygenase, partial [Pseudomonadota bacterium]
MLNDAGRRVADVDLKVGAKRSVSVRTVRQNLRQSTQILHDQVEALWISGERFSDRARYEEFLGALLTAHVTLGMGAARTRGAGEEITMERRRIAALRSDLGSRANQTEPPATIDRMGRSFAWGVGYVLNGSALGAKMILKHGYVEPD